MESSQQRRSVRVELCEEHTGYIEECMTVHGLSPFVVMPDGEPMKMVAQLGICNTFVHIAPMIPGELLPEICCPICFLNKYDFSRWINQVITNLEGYLHE